MKQKQENNSKTGLMITETWLTVPKFPDYEVSNLGKVKSKGRFKRWMNYVRWEDDIILSLGNNKERYQKVTLRNGETIKRFTVHYLVLLCFVGERPYKNDINHLNGIKNDNRLINIEYCTRSQNSIHANNIGLTAKNYKIRQGFGINSHKI